MKSIETINHFPYFSHCARGYTVHCIWQRYKSKNPFPNLESLSVGDHYSDLSYLALRPPKKGPTLAPPF